RGADGRPARPQPHWPREALLHRRLLERVGDRPALLRRGPHERDAPRADRLVLLSPEIGVAPFSRLTELLSGLALVPFFEKTRWLDVFPEYIPFKYNSFPVNAGRQSLKITNALQKALQKATDDGKIKQLPPILAFQSLVDATIRTGDVVDKLFDRLADNGSDLVLFDINRSNVLKQFLTSPGEDLIARLARGSHPYRFTFITNAGPETPDVVERSYPKAGGGAAADQPLGLAWPKHFFSLSHVALPFASDDPLFGSEPNMRENSGMRLGLAIRRGEKSVLKAPLETFMRLNSNPFFSYVDRRITDWLPAGN